MCTQHDYTKYDCTAITFFDWQKERMELQNDEHKIPRLGCSVMNTDILASACLQMDSLIFIHIYLLTSTTINTLKPLHPHKTCMDELASNVD